eukprot:g19626.t1
MPVRTRLSADDRSKLRLPDVSRRKVALDFSSSDAAATKVVLIDDDEAAKSRAENAVSAILQQIDFIVSESMGFFGPVEDLSYGNSALYSSLEVLHLLPVPEPPELSLLHEELGASCASVAQEFPQNIVPPERRADTTSAETGTLRAKAVRIRGSPDSAYPFMKGGDKMPEISTTMKQEMLVADPGGIEDRLSLFLRPQMSTNKVCLKKRPVEDEASRYAITFGEVALLHIGGRELGAPRALGGFTVPELVAVAQGLPNAELVALSDVLPEELRKENEAATLVIRNGASATWS